MKFLFVTFVVVIFSYPLNASAIVNVEEMRVGPPKDGFSGNLDLSLNGKSGNTSKQEMGLNSRLQWQQDRVTNFIVLFYDYAENDHMENTNRAFVHGRHVVRYQPRRAWEIFAQTEENKFARLSYRRLLGAGLRFTLIEKEKLLGLYVGVGGFWTSEKLDQEAGLTDQTSENYARANFYLVYQHKLNEQLSLISTTYYQPRLNDGGDFRTLEQAGLAVKMTEYLSLKLSLDISHDSRPPQTVDKTDTSYSTSLSYKF